MKEQVGKQTFHLIMTLLILSLTFFRGQKNNTSSTAKSSLTHFFPLKKPRLLALTTPEGTIRASNLKLPM